MKLQGIALSKRQFLATELLKELHAFNILTDEIVRSISVSHEVNAKGICEKEGIIYTIQRGVGVPGRSLKER